MIKLHLVSDASFVVDRGLEWIDCFDSFLPVVIFYRRLSSRVLSAVTAAAAVAA